VQIRIVGSDLPGVTCGESGNFPGYDNIHVAVQRRNHPQELLGLVAGDAPSARWDLDCEVVDTPGGVDVKGPYVQGRPDARFIYLSWGTVGADGAFTMFRRAKLWLDGVAPDVMTAARRSGTLVGRLGLSDECGHPLCASVRPPRISWSAA
jgi:hypothetical protein